MSVPKLSFIVLSYNYQDYIGTTLRSILDQTVQDFEVVVVDDCSTDDSRAVVESFGDPRIRLLVNERNLGGAGSYNVAVQAARGEWLVNLDADDWIAPEKCARQLAALARDPALDIIGSWVCVVDAAGERHPRADEWEGLSNREFQLNRVETWIGQNPLCRSSTMVRRAAHLRIGLDDPDMVRAPDYELWTRALAMGCRFGLLHQPLTYQRLQARGVTHADPIGTLLELAYAAVRNLAPLAERRALFDAHSEMLSWFANHAMMIALTPQQSFRLMGQLLTLPPQTDFRSFRESLSAAEPSPELERVGKHGLLHGKAYLSPATADRLHADIAAYIGARDYWHGRSDVWEREALAYRDALLAERESHLAERENQAIERAALLEALDNCRTGVGVPTATYLAHVRHRIKASIKRRMVRSLSLLRGNSGGPPR